MKPHSIAPGKARNECLSPGQNLTSLEKFLSQSFAVPRILVADDDQTTSELLRSIGGTERYDVVSVADGREAFRLLRTDTDFKLAIFNMTMPHLQGVEIVRYMKTEKRLMRIPVVLMSSADGITMVAEAFAAGAIAFLPKPLNTDQLQLTVRLALNAKRDTHKIQRAA